VYTVHEEALAWARAGRKKPQPTGKTPTPAEVRERFRPWRRPAWSWMLMACWQVWWAGQGV